jgi:hypothetical protein
MKKLMATCIDKNNPSDMVEHEVRGEIDGRPFVITLYATDPMDAIRRAEVTPAHLWRLDVPEVRHA